MQTWMIITFAALYVTASALWHVRVAAPLLRQLRSGR